MFLGGETVDRFPVRGLSDLLGDFEVHKRLTLQKEADRTIE